MRGHLGHKVGFCLEGSAPRGARVPEQYFDRHIPFWHELAVQEYIRESSLAQVPNVGGIGNRWW